MALLCPQLDVQAALQSLLLVNIQTSLSADVYFFAIGYVSCVCMSDVSMEEEKK